MYFYKYLQVLKLSLRNYVINKALNLTALLCVFVIQVKVFFCLGCRCMDFG